jgi:prepilin-type N-terminal cleavage/methylation domain-containing protein
MTNYWSHSRTLGGLHGPDHASYPCMHNQLRRLGSTGFSLVEMLIVVSMIGLMGLFAWPKVVMVLNQGQVGSARLAVLNKFNQARINARQSSRSAYLIRSEDVLWIERQPRVVPLAGSLRDTIGGYLNLDRSFGVTATVSSDTVAVDARGLTAGTWRILLARGAARDSVVISGFGRVTR